MFAFPEMFKLVRQNGLSRSSNHRALLYFLPAPALPDHQMKEKLPRSCESFVEAFVEDVVVVLLLKIGLLYLKSGNQFYNEGQFGPKDQLSLD